MDFPSTGRWGRTSGPGRKIRAAVPNPTAKAATSGATDIAADIPVATAAEAIEAAAAITAALPHAQHVADRWHVAKNLIEHLDKVVSSLSIQVSSLFRDPRFYLAFRQRAVPLLRTYPSIRIWHAGCATGEEVYSMAILLTEEALFNKCRLYGTDLNPDALATASRGSYAAPHIARSERDYKEAGGTRSLSDYFQISGKEATILQSLQGRVTFFQHNLVTDASFNDFHVIFCRNVLIYFSRPLQDRVHELLYHSLVRFGVLGLGANERLHITPREKHYRSLDETARLYRRTD